MGFTKFVSILETEALYFSRVENLGDPFEGSQPLVRINPVNNITNTVSKEVTEEEKIRKGFLGHVAVNCWHMNDHESAAMWNIYGGDLGGVAIQSTFKRLMRSFKDKPVIYLGMVEYIDYDSDSIDIKNRYAPLLHKRKSFEHEKEVRAVVTKRPYNPDGTIDPYTETIISGLNVPVKIDELVEGVYVSPKSPTWFAELVRKVVERYNHNFPINQSRLDDPPVY